MAKLQNYFSRLFKACAKSMLYAMLIFNFSVMESQERSITGTVTDASQNPLPGVSVIIKGTTVGVITDLNGNFKITVSDPNAVLVFKSIGFADQEIQVGNQSQLKITMQEKVEELDQVVVVGYGVQKRSDVTGSVASVSADKLTKLPIAGIDQALQGLAAGVNIIPVSGRPGSGVDIQIRGITSINGTRPLIIIDGVGRDQDALSRLNPGDIESIEVLKDASSAAIYGASGGNGVILVTTKKGKSGEITTSFNSYLGTEEVIKKLELMNSQQWMELLEEMSPTRLITSRPDTLKTYDWQDIVFNKAYTKNYELSFNGGNERSNFLMSASYIQQEGILKKTDNNRFTFRLNSEHKLKYFKFSERISYTNNKRYGFEDWEYMGYYQNIIATALQMAPYLPPYDANGKWSINQFGGGTNPLVQLDMKNRTVKNDNIEALFELSIEPIKGLNYTTRFTGTGSLGDSKEFRDIYYASATDNRKQNELFQSLSRGYSWNYQNIITYTNNIGDHNLTLMAGSEASRWWGYDLNGTRVDFSNTLPELLYMSMSENDTLDKQTIEGSGYEGRNYRYFGRLNYDFKNKYLLTINVSRDYASNFGPANRAGTFPSFSLGWKFSEEAFIKDNFPIISFGKLRVGYGETGANARSGFPYATNIVFPPKFKYSFDNNVSQIGAGPEQVANPGIKWETVKMTNIGLDLNFFDNKLSFIAEYFIKENNGMLMYQQVPFVAGTFAISNPEVNMGTIQNKGLEFTLGYKNKVGEFKYSVDANISIVRNKILDLATDSILDGAAHNVSPIALTRIGGSVSEYYGYKTNGMFTEADLGYYRGKLVIVNQPFTVNAKGDTIFAQRNAKPGDVRYVDLNNDGVINESDKTILGSPLPKFTYSLSFNFEYLGFDLNMMIYGSYGNKVFNGTKQYLYYSQGNGNRLAVFANRYKDEIVKDGFVAVRENHNTDIPRFAADNYTKPSDFFIEDGSYLRLRNIQLGYTIPSKISTKIGIQRFRIYVGAKNLLTLTSYKAFNPEVSSFSGNAGRLTALGVDYGTYPATKMYLVGLNLQF